MGDFVLTLITAIMENWVGIHHWNLDWVMYVIFVPLILMYAIIFAKVIYDKWMKKS